MTVLRSRTPRDILNEIRFRGFASGCGAGDPGLGGVEAAILDRVGPESRPTLRRIRGPDILRLEHGFLYVSGKHGETAIPYHRVQSISWEGREVWRRRVSAPG